MSYVRDNPNQKYLFFDFETCHLSLLDSNFPWSVSYIIYQNGDVFEKHEHYIKWEPLPISDGAAKITRFDRNVYQQKAEDPNKVLDKFESYLLDNQYVIVGHNLMNFDIYVLKIWRKALGRKNDYSYLDRVIDTNALARAIKKGVKKIDRKDWKTVMFRFANYVEKGLKTNLTALGKEFKIDVDYEALHSANNDVLLNIKVWEKLKWQIEI